MKQRKIQRGNPMKVIVRLACGTCLFFGAAQPLDAGLVLSLPTEDAMEQMKQRVLRRLEKELYLRERIQRSRLLDPRQRETFESCLDEDLFQSEEDLAKLLAALEKAEQKKVLNDVGPQDEDL